MNGAVEGLSSSVIATLNEPSTITTTLTPTSSERILELIVEPPASVPAGFAAGRDRSGADAAAALAARRAAAMKLEALACSLVASAISLIASSEAAMRSDGVPTRPCGRVPGSSGKSGGSWASTTGREAATRSEEGGVRAADGGSRMSLIAFGISVLGVSVLGISILSSSFFGAAKAGAGSCEMAVAANSRGAASNCASGPDRACGGTGVGSTGSAFGGVGCTGLANCGRGGGAMVVGLTVARATGACGIGGAGGAVFTLRRSPSIIARRSTTWPSVACTTSSESWVWRSVSDWLKRMSESSRLMVSTSAGSIVGRLRASVSAAKLACWRSRWRRMSCSPSSTRPRLPARGSLVVSIRSSR